MPKAEKELRKDVTPLQQEIKRKTQEPGTPTDVGPWIGAANTLIRCLSSLPVPKYAFQFIGALSNFPIPQYAFQFVMNTTISVLNIKMTSPPILSQVFHFSSTILKFVTLLLEHNLGFTDTTLKNMNSTLQDSLTLNDSCTPVKS